MQTRRKEIGLHQTQIDFRRSAAIYRAFISGRGGGKSFVGAYDTIRRAKRDRTYMIGSPTATMMRDITFPTVKAIASDLGVWNQKNVRMSPYPTAILRTGAELRFRTADNPDSMRGPNLSGCWLDEASLMEEEAYLINIAALREAGEQGWMSVTATPKGMSHWTYLRFGVPQPDTELFTCATKSNPFLPKTFAETLAKQFTGAWALQELGGLFVSMEGAEFLAEWFEDRADRPFWFDRWPHPSEVLLTIIALDPSKGRDARTGKDGRGGDYSAFVILKLTKDGTMWIDADMDNRRPLTQIVTDGIGLFMQHRPDAFAVEINQFQELLAKDFLREAFAQRPPLIIPMWGWDNRVNKEVRIRRLAPILAGIDGRMRFKGDSIGAALLVSQLRDFRAPPHPSEYHDDGPDALEMAVRMLLHLMSGGAADQVGGPLPMGR